jgi:hypothetical protein
LPLSYAFRYASRLSVAGSWHLIQNSRVAYSLYCNPVRKRTTCIGVTPHLDTQIVGGTIEVYCLL